MSLQVHDFLARYADGVPSLIVDGEDIVAHVHKPEYLPLFLHAPEMRRLIENLSNMRCDPARIDHDSDTCGTCQARVLLADMRRSIESRPVSVSEFATLG
jgi:hypothetical protein